MSYAKYAACAMPFGMCLIKKVRFKNGCNSTTQVLRWLEQIDVSRMVDKDILMQIWKNCVKQIDFVLKWLSRVESEVRLTKGKLEP
ncbi:hypothetical protein TNCV_3006911 [Trichonephila clavipes]|nr:hypothetical protein TNCV_3006911 [Trichonephila clavipes]